MTLFLEPLFLTREDWIANGNLPLIQMFLPILADLGVLCAIIACVGTPGIR